MGVNYAQVRSIVTVFDPFRVVLLPGIIEFSLNFQNIGIGQPSTALASSLADNYRQDTVYVPNLMAEQLKDLLWSGIPVMALSQVGSFGPVHSGCLGFTADVPSVGNVCFGVPYHIDARYPELHWYVVVGYDQSVVYLKDTGSNATVTQTWTDFEIGRNWTRVAYNNDIGRLMDVKGASPRDAIFFSQPLQDAKVFRVGERYPQLNAKVIGFGKGEIVSSSGFRCRSNCSTSILINTPLSLTAVPDPGSTFQGWGGDCSGLGVCNITMTNAKSVTAEFSDPVLLRGFFATLANFQIGRPQQPSFPISINVSGPGRVTSSVLNSHCFAACTGLSSEGDVVQFVANAQADSGFIGWSGACSGTQPTCQLQVNSASVVNAQFMTGNVTTGMLVVEVGGTGAGRVVGQQAGIDCGAECRVRVVAGATVNLTAEAGEDSFFAGWSSVGSDATCSGSLQPCVVSVTDFETVSAEFSKQNICHFAFTPDNLNVSVDGGQTHSQISVADSCVWDVRSKSSWIAPLSMPGGVGPNTLRLQVEENHTGLPRIGQIELTSAADTNVRIILSVSQSPSLFGNGFE